jgi:hypothetical protein
MIFGGVLHNDEVCRYGSHWEFSFSGPVLFISEHERKVANVKLSSGHTTRGGFFVALEGCRPTHFPALITDALDTRYGPGGVLRFTPADPSVEWAGTYGSEVSGDAEPIYYGVFSDGWFGVIQFTSVDTARVQTFISKRLPATGDELYFTDSFERIGTLLSLDAEPA